MSRYILIDHASGFIWGDTAAFPALPGIDVEPIEPLQAAIMLDEQIGGERRSYEEHAPAYRPGWNVGAYLVYKAPVGFPPTDDGQDAAMIERVENECELIAIVTFERAEPDDEEIAF